MDKILIHGGLAIVIFVALNSLVRDMLKLRKSLKRATSDELKILVTVDSTDASAAIQKMRDEIAVLYDEAQRASGVLDKSPELLCEIKARSQEIRQLREMMCADGTSMTRLDELG